MKERLKAHWIIKLFSGSKLHVKVGDLVNKGYRLLSVDSKIIKSFSDSHVAKLSPKIKEEINQFFQGKFLRRGDLIYRKNGFFPLKILAPCDALFLKIDEFNNIQMEVEERENKEIRSPTRAKIIRIDDEKLVLEFIAVEIRGENLIEGKSWGESDFEEVSTDSLNSKHNGNVVFSKEISQSFLVKAQVLGVVAIVTLKNDFNFDKINTSLPILALDEVNWNKLKEYRGKNRQVLVNTKLGRLLIVVE
ncbi:MAG: hypothetical protein WCG91_04120 [Candidatus Shapirobacteria bacterium]